MPSTETTPLLATVPPEPAEPPLPKLQIALLCYARLVEPIAYFTIFPFVNKMIFEMGNVEESDVGFYSGLIVCIKPCHFVIATYFATGIIVQSDTDVSYGMFHLNSLCLSLIRQHSFRCYGGVQLTIMVVSQSW